MYTQFFRLAQIPFSIAPDPHFLFMSERHREALAHLLYGVGSGGGFVLLTGEIGAGKTTVCRCFLEQIPPACNVGYIFNPRLTVTELLKSICDEFHIAIPQQQGGMTSVKDYVDPLNHYLLTSHAQGRSNVLIIDEAQSLSTGVLEQLRLLTNLETNESKLLQIILIGQPELRTMLARPELEQLAQRVIARYHLDSLSTAESARYIQHRLAIAGLAAASPFSRASMRLIHRLADGVPRRINLLCDRALLGAYAEGKQSVDRGIVKKAAQEVFGGASISTSMRRRTWRVAATGLMAGAAIAGAAAWAIGSGYGGWHMPAGITVTAPLAPAVVARAVAKSPDAARKDPAVPTAVVLSDLSAPIGPAGSDESLAFQSLAQAWGVTLTAQADGPCNAALKIDLHCYRSSGGIVEIRQLDRPALLTLHDDENKPYYALLIGLTNAHAMLRLDGSTSVVSLLTLARHFHGDFVTLWRAPAGFHEKIAIGERGIEVDWLASQLAKLNGITQPTANQRVDQSMVDQVLEFQLAHGLKVDGVVGPQTFMHINNAAGVNEPRLQATIVIANSSPGK